MPKQCLKIKLYQVCGGEHQEKTHMWRIIVMDASQKRPFMSTFAVALLAERVD